MRHTTTIDNKNKKPGFSLSLLLDLNISSPTLVLLLLLSIVCHLSQIDLQDYEMVNGIGNYICWPVSNIVKEKVS